MGNRAAEVGKMENGKHASQSPPAQAIADTVRCEFAGSCALFEHLVQSRDDVYRAAYCDGNFKACERYKLRLRGVIAPDDLMPFGYQMQPDGSAYPVDPALPCDTRTVEVGLLIYWIVILGMIMASSAMQ
jgi:hypothetical protein